MKALVSSLTILATLTACGGGGGGSKEKAPAIPDATQSAFVVPKEVKASIPAKTFSLKKLNSTTPGLIYSADLLITELDGTKTTGTISISNRPEIYKNGVMVTPNEMFISYIYVSKDDGKSYPDFYLDTSYVDTSTGSVVASNWFGECTSTSPYHMPDSVKIGDAEVISPMICNGLDIQEGLWRVEDAGNGAARVTFTYTYKMNNKMVYATETAYTINTDGTILSFKRITTDLDIEGHPATTYTSK